ncbi:hypothetical protein F4677DRAFT_422822 [Hypoxylon crocopeplum]|nr:hypothetical protein F4677DRAFT_422822 [Hypoxylon crocopeplum]
MASPQLDQHTGQKIGVRHTSQIIRFILERTIPERPLERGRQGRLYSEVANLVNVRFQPEMPYGPKNIKYITNMYGRDPKYGNRKGKVVYPARNKTGNRTGRDSSPAKDKRVRCPYCDGSGYLEAGGAGHGADSGEPQTVESPARPSSATRRGSEEEAGWPTGYALNEVSYLHTRLPQSSRNFIS